MNESRWVQDRAHDGLNYSLDIGGVELAGAPAAGAKDCRNARRTASWCGFSAGMTCPAQASCQWRASQILQNINLHCGGHVNTWHSLWTKGLPRPNSGGVSVPSLPRACVITMAFSNASASSTQCCTALSRRQKTKPNGERLTPHVVQQARRLQTAALPAFRQQSSCTASSTPNFVPCCMAHLLDLVPVAPQVDGRHLNLGVHARLMPGVPALQSGRRRYIEHL